MQFDHGGRAAGRAQRSVQRSRVAADTGDALRQGFTLLVFFLQHGGRQYASHGATAHTGNAVVAGFFRQEVDHLEGVVEHDVLLFQRVGDLDACQHAYDAVVTSAAHHGVAM